MISYILEKKRLRKIPLGIQQYETKIIKDLDFAKIVMLERFFC